MIPDRLRELVLQAAEYTYKRSFKVHLNGTDSEHDTVVCSICMERLREPESSTGGTVEGKEPNPLTQVS